MHKKGLPKKSTSNSVHKHNLEQLTRLLKQVNTLNAQADLHFQRKEYKEAIKVTLVELKQREKMRGTAKLLEDEGIIVTASAIHLVYWRLGKSYLELGNKVAAKEYFIKTSTFNSELTVSAINNLIALYDQEGNEKLAYKYTIMLETKKLLSKLDKTNQSTIFLFLARIYRSGKAGKHKDFNRSQAYYNLANRNNPNILAEQVGLYSGVDFPEHQDSAKYREYLEKAAQAGVLEAIHILACNYDEALNHFPLDKTKSFNLFKQAAKQGAGYPPAIYNYGYMLLYGEATPADPIEGFHYIHIAATKGVTKAKIELARCFTNGLGVAADLSQAEKIYLSLVESEDDPRVAHNLSLLYQAKQDYLNFKKYAQKAATKGHAGAYFNMGLICLSGMAGNEIDVLLAIDYYKKAFELNLFEAGVTLISIYLQTLLAKTSYSTSKKVYNNLLHVLKKLRQLDNERSVVFKPLYEINLDIDSTDVYLNIFKTFEKNYRQTFIGLNNNIIETAHLAISPNRKVEHILSLIDQPMDRINIMTLIYNVSQLFMTIDTRKKSMSQYLEKLNNLFSKVAENLVSLNLNDSAKILFHFSKLGIHPEEDKFKDCLKLLTCKLEDTEQLLPPNVITDLLAGVSRLGLPLSDKFIKRISETIASKRDHFDFKQLASLLYSLAVIHSNNNPRKLVNSNLLRILYTQLSQSTATGSMIHNHQLSMATFYFKQRYPDSSYILFKPNESPEGMAMLEHPISVSQLQRRVTSALKELGFRFKQECLINDLLPVDILLEDGRVIQVDGPTHYLHAGLLKLLLSPKDHFHDAIIGRTVIHLPYFELDLLESKSKLKSYLLNKIGPPKSHNSDIAHLIKQRTTLNVVPDKCTSTGEDNQKKSTHIVPYTNR